MNAWLRWVVEVEIAAALAVSATQTWAQGTSHMEDWLGLPKEGDQVDLEISYALPKERLRWQAGGEKGHR
ncbi:MAG: hypothetical protein A3F84_18765 [Candidatus Handelsmanbacteria bacterium RIFCSPLOWO2_12_FULL_64_10]|uniref:Uncharacterized protein n=1 Tax=Handelsmanbacteria sp. (strain RIFCSPLOWO2_12_FULL_64_10) TaxID=1817868 RepID=A0A1F6D2E4_HANXR|nr:MAG: hypothetical protein A3F84_18765 [Candidatus Handelsmanbacteria bacterium RIFCSPLOWO2_12_FULL_64_10]